MPLPKVFVIFSASQSGYWEGTGYTPNVEEAKQYSTKNLADTDINDACYAGGFHKSEEHTIRPYVSLAKQV